MTFVIIQHDNPHKRYLIDNQRDAPDKGKSDGIALQAQEKRLIHSSISEMD